jgi:hypothetical protein
LDVIPRPVLKLPTGQEEHTLALMAVLNVPAEQAVQAVWAGADANLPWLHATHTLELQALATLPAVPGPQSVHVTVPNRPHCP